MGRRRRILLQERDAPRNLRVTFIACNEAALANGMVIETKHQLIQSGYSVNFANKTLTDLKMDVQRVARLVEKTETDAWVVISASKEVIRWFAAQPTPAFALHGEIMHIDIAGTGADKSSAYQTAARRLLDLGHRRIVLLQSEHERCSLQDSPVNKFFQEMEARDIRTGSYNHPHWTNTPSGLRQCIASLYKHTPPTALIIDTPSLYHAVVGQLAYQKIFAPNDVSLICADEDSSFRWIEPSIACFRWSRNLFSNRIVRWVDQVARGKKDLSQRLVKAEFVDGGTVGPVPKR